MTNGGLRVALLHSVYRASYGNIFSLFSSNTFTPSQVAWSRAISPSCSASYRKQTFQLLLLKSDLWEGSYRGTSNISYLPHRYWKKPVLHVQYRYHSKMPPLRHAPTNTSGVRFLKVLYDISDEYSEPARCSVTTFVLSVPWVRTCVGCNRKAFLPRSADERPLPNHASGWVVTELLEAVDRCLFCGNGFVSIL